MFESHRRHQIPSGGGVLLMQTCSMWPVASQTDHGWQAGSWLPVRIPCPERNVDLVKCANIGGAGPWLLAS